MSNRPMPEPDLITNFYWEGAKNEQLLIQHCADCGHWNHPPKERCPACGSRQLTGEPVPLKGEVYSYSVTNQSRVSGFEEKVPYIVVTIALEAVPVKIICNLLECQPEHVRIGMPVDIVFEHAGPFSLPQAKPSQSHQ